MTLILVVEDELDVASVLEYNLRGEGYETLVATTADRGIKMAYQSMPDLVLLDLMLPDRPGTEVCRALKRTPATKHIPIIMVTARNEEIDRVVGFELGVDDYVTKPFSVRELLLRIKRLLGRGAVSSAPVAPSNDPLLTIDRAAHRIYVGDKKCDLSSIEYRLLLTLFDNQNRVLTRVDLLKAVWGKDSTVYQRTIDAHVKRLRTRLGVAGAHIETVRGVGYRYGVPQQESSEPRRKRARWQFREQAGEVADLADSAEPADSAPEGTD